MTTQQNDKKAPAKRRGKPGPKAAIERLEVWRKDADIKAEYLTRQSGRQDERIKEMEQQLARHFVQFGVRLERHHKELLKAHHDLTAEVRRLADAAQSAALSADIHSCQAIEQLQLVKAALQNLPALVANLITLQAPADPPPAPIVLLRQTDAAA